METCLTSFVSSFLQCVLGEPPSQAQLDLFLAVARRADYEKLTKGDFIIPLNSPKLREVADPNTPFGNFIHNPTEDNLKMVERALEACRLPVGKVCVQNKMLRIHLDHPQVMKTFLPRVAREGLRYGANALLKQVPIVLSHYAAQREHAGLKYTRGIKLANHITRILEFCGASVDASDTTTSGTGPESKDEEYMIVSREECEPEAACPLASEPQDSQNPQHSRLPGTSVNPASYCVVNERESAKGLPGHMCGDAVRQKLLVDGGLDSPPERQVDSSNEASGVSGEMYVMCAPSNEVVTTETQTPYYCVSERLEWPEKADAERQTDETKGEEHSAQLTQDETQRQKERRPSDVIEFVITDSMKGIQNSPWVYQYFGVVDGKTGNPWTGSVEEYCRILTEELKRTSEMRHGDMDGSDRAAFLEEQTQRCLTLQLLMPSHSSQLRVEVDGDTHNVKEAAFMLYNYARLCSIFDHFEQCVQQEEVAPLPPAEDVDFSLLKHDEEWELVWLYILRWPELLQDVASGVTAGTRKPKSGQVARFLYSLSHRWSEYYGRHQVVPEGFLPHLLPLMHARLHLLSSLHAVMRSCFSVLGVTTLPSYM
ncbi:uncharacterized protein LOC126983231 isoform X2 [Eriocheir sinensis]|nr:uncharacterized protein LOC126983231 isoform X2 [Eriocheir sinensis]XP_050691822.1 uncharacterized protein LOC126983231 isoform X2 [Eriocheir sinensis]XP_050691823.1 uncharacterized protein LOC126983231 isoform X2 [Eriocheir sinensis]XP_050691824.1 uncharacterized protein LOC126983231 isoform X2 [Eriocheir sinensis]XP_050691825.1 uncharacterized protein LOC126983231 isoform X2 [Eriocheir sinensis]XP_050691826.1 uncharacterized protein LOC126983231 isoform X2 [Eriocheir sinensis]